MAEGAWAGEVVGGAREWAAVAGLIGSEGEHDDDLAMRTSDVGGGESSGEVEWETHRCTSDQGEVRDLAARRAGARQHGQEHGST